MRICLLNRDMDRHTGSGRFCLSLVEALKEIEPNISVAALTTEDDLGRGWLRFLCFGFLKLRSAIKHCDVVHALDGWPYGVKAVLAGLGLNRKVVITAVGTGAVKPLYQPFKKQLLAWAYRRADKVVAVSGNTRKEILRVVPDLEVEVINHGVDYRKYQISPLRQGFEGQANIKYQNDSKIQNLKPYILSVGALKKRKGYNYSIKAFAGVSEDFPELRYVIVGQGPELGNIQFLISNFQLQGRVVVFSKVEEDFLTGLYRNAELFILLPQDDNKDIEGFGLVFLEAAAAGLPVVSSLGSSAEDAVLNGKNGILVRSQDYQAAAGAIIKIISDGDLRTGYSKASLDFAREMNWGKAAQSYLRVYKAAS